MIRLHINRLYTIKFDCNHSNNIMNATGVLKDIAVFLENQPPNYLKNSQAKLDVYRVRLDFEREDGSVFDCFADELVSFEAV